MCNFEGDISFRSVQNFWVAKVELSVFYTRTIVLYPKSGVSLFLSFLGAAADKLREIYIPVPPVNGLTTIDLQVLLSVRHYVVREWSRSFLIVFKTTNPLEI